MKYTIINGPNLNLQGLREPEVYGNVTFESFLTHLQQLYPNIELDYYQSNIEGDLINKIQAAGFSCDGLIVNLGGYSHTSVALHDALQAVPATAIEVHISNIFAREEYRHHSLISSACQGMICGLGLDGYRLAIEALLSLKN